MTRTLSIVRRIQPPTGLLVEVLSSWDVGVESVTQSSKGGRPRRDGSFEWRGKVRR